MIQIHVKTQLLKLLKQLAPLKAIQRAMETGTVELLGVFDPLPTSSSKGWIITVVGIRTWHIAIALDPPRCWLIKEISWKDWAGEKYTNPLYCGDNPDKYVQLVKNTKRS